MQYIIAHKGNIIYGPVDYNQSFFRKVLVNELFVNENRIALTDVEPTQVIKIDEIVISPAKISKDIVLTAFQEFSGPFWTFNDEIAIGTYMAIDKSIELVKAEFKEKVAAARYEKEIEDIMFDLDGETIRIDASRASKANLASLILSMSDTEVIDFKFNLQGVFKSCNKKILSSIHTAISEQSKAAFSWEASKVIEIDTAEELDDLRLFSLN